MVKHRKKFFLTFLLSLVFNVFHDYVFVVLEDKNIEVILLEDSKHCSDKNVDIHKVLHSPFLVLNNSFKLENPKESKKYLLSQTLSQKPLQSDIFKPPITL